ncbi:MAG: hypothetical protein ACP5D6_09250, partial [Kosmotogaceae bacterium]
SDIKKIVNDKDCQLFNNGPHKIFLSKRGREVVGRIAFGIDRKLNEYKGVNHAYFTLFES